MSYRKWLSWTRLRSQGVTEDLSCHSSLGTNRQQKREMESGASSDLFQTVCHSVPSGNISHCLVRCGCFYTACLKTETVSDLMTFQAGVGLHLFLTISFYSGLRNVIFSPSSTCLHDQCCSTLVTETIREKHPLTSSPFPTEQYISCFYDELIYHKPAACKTNQKIDSSFVSFFYKNKFQLYNDTIDKPPQSGMLD